MEASAVIPYCGLPPTPEALWGRWNLDPVLISVLVGLLAAYIIVRRRPPPSSAWRTPLFVAGWVILSLALISPLCPLSVSLFSARVGQHMILSLVAAPLLVLGCPPSVQADRSGAGSSRLGGLHLSFGTRAALATLGFTLAIWFWHAPGPYDATFSSTIVYWLMHLTVVGTALAVWSILLDARPERAAIVLAVGAASTLQMTFLGALITLTPHLLYAPHILTPYTWGMTQGGDQQLGGLIMWVPGCTVFLAVTLYTLARMMAERPQPTALA